MKLLDELKTRGIFNNITNEDKFNKLKKGESVYIGFDPTAESLHLGNFIQIALLLRFKNHGFKPIAVLGGATGMIGDPSGKSEERSLLSQETLIKNKIKIKKQLEKYGLDVVDNFDFYKNMNILEFFRDVGKLININYMISKEIVSSRIEKGISFTEFAYQLIQGWDFKQLYDKHNVKVQLGGSDQWGNITTGIEIIRKTNGDDNKAVGITTNLLTTSSGKKFGKSEGNAIWIDDKMTPPYQMYQYLLNTSDQDVKTILNWITLLHEKEINEIINTHLKEPSKRCAQKKLAFEIVSLVHNEEAAKTSKKLSDVLFGKDNIKDLSYEQLSQLSGSVPEVESKEANILDIIVAVGASSSKTEARKFVKNNAIEVNGEKIIDENFIVRPKDFDKKLSILRRGKKNYYLIKH